MKQKSLLILIVVTVTVLGAAWMISEQRAPTKEVAKASLYANLIAQVNNVVQIDVRNAEHRTELERVDNKWQIANRDGYPARFEAVKQVVVGIAELAILETKTSVPERYPRLRVEDVDTPDAKSLQVTLKDAEQTVLADLIVGKSRVSSGSSGVAALYVRKAGEPQALLVEGQISVGAEPTRWWDNSIINIASARIRRISIRHADSAPVIVYRDSEQEQDFGLENLPAAHELKSPSVITSMAGVLSGLRFDDVAAYNNLEFTGTSTETTITTFDGLVVSAVSGSVEGLTYTRFSAQFDAAAAAAEEEEQDAGDDKEDETPEEADQPGTEREAADLNARLNTWGYVLPEYKLSQLTKRFEELVQPIEEPDDAEQSE